MLGTSNKKLIIVTDSSTEVYGELLVGLITMKKNEAEETGSPIIKPLPNNVEVVIWDEEVYKKNNVQMSSSNKIVFIGKNKASNNIYPNIMFNNLFKKYGAYYGYFGNKAMIYVDDDMLNEGEAYSEFVDCYQKYLQGVKTDFAKIEFNKLAVIEEDHSEDKLGIMADTLIDVANKGIEGINKGIKAIIDGANSIGDFFSSSSKTPKIESKENQKKYELIPLIQKNEVSTGEFRSFKLVKAKSNKDVLDQQYRAAVISFYVEALQKFME
ncbi:MAG: hypothetical protein MJ113_06530 [Lachnospiraceae bacterium]|nr:hypothetical protein [Lachnospiraceae bacterium]